MSTPVSTKIEYKMNAFVIYGLKNGEKINFPQRFMTKLIGTVFDQRWDNPSPTAGSICKNLAELSQANSSLFNNEIVYSGKIAEVTFQDKIDLMGWDGQEIEHPLPPAKGQRDYWRFRILPKYNILVLENGRSVEKKLTEYLNFFCIQKYNSGLSTDQQLDGILIEAVPVESNPVGYLRENPNLGSFEAVIKAREFQNENYGIFGKLFEGLAMDEERLVIKVSITSSRRGRDLPQVLVTHLADFLDNIADDDLNQARVSEFDDGKKLRPTKLLGAFHHSKKFIDDDDESKDKALNSYTNSIASEIGVDLRIDE